MRGGGGNVGGVSHLCAFRWPTLATAAGYDATRCRSFGESLFDLLFFFFFFHHRVSLGQVRIEIIVGNNRRKERRHAHVSRLRRQLRDNLRRTTSSRSLTGETCERTNAQRSTKRTRSGDLCASRSATCSARQSVRDTRTVYVHGVIECLR